MLRGALIGIGKIAQSGHLPAFADPRIQHRAQIVAAADPSPASRDIAHRASPGIRLYGDAATLAANEQVDFLDICTTPQAHKENIEWGLSHRLHLLCEKPLANSLKDATLIASLLRNEPTLAFVPCHQYRYSPLWQHFKKFLAHPPAQRGFLVEFNVYRTEADPGLHRGGPVWRTEREASGGGILADTGVHYLYLALWMLGMPLRVTTRLHRLAHQGTDVEDTAFVTLEYEHGFVEIVLTWAADRRANSARAITRDSSLVYDGQSLVRRFDDQAEQIPVPDASDKTHYVSLYVDLIDEFLDHVHSGAPCTQWVDEAHQAVLLLHACYRSADAARTVTLAEMT
jgi:predicted dehydrogenase